MLKQALRCGIAAEAFWAMTPVETWMAIEAFIWQDDRRQQHEAIVAWRTAALMRSKRMPSLKSYLSQSSGPDVKPLRGEALAQKQAEFREMSAAVDMEQLTKQLANLTKKKKKDVVSTR